MKNIAFFCPSKVFGGAENLIIRVSKAMIILGYEITIIDYKEGVIITSLLNIPEIRFLEYEDDKTLMVKDVTYMVSFALWIDKIRNQIIAQNRIFLLIWFIHPYHIFNLIKPLPKKPAQYVYVHFKRKIKQMLEEMDLKGSLKFMDYENYYISKKYFKLNFEPEYLQIPVNYNIIKKESKTVSEELSIVWIGRLPSYKVNSLIYVLDRIREYSIRTRRFLHFYIVGSGSSEGLLEGYIDNHHFKYIKIIRMDKILPENIPDFLSGKKLLIAMGTAALEGGVEKVPTILLDYSYYNYKKILQKDYKFKWLYKTKDFTLGSNIFKSHKFLKKENNLDIDDIFDIILDPLKSEAVALECYNYSFHHHNMETVVHKLLDDLESCTFTIHELSNIKLNKSLFERIVDNAYIIGRKAKHVIFK